MTNDFVKMLTEKSVCGGGYSEKICYDIGEELFGFDSANINMVMLLLFASFRLKRRWRNTVSCQLLAEQFWMWL